MTTALRSMRESYVRSLAREGGLGNVLAQTVVQRGIRPQSGCMFLLPGRTMIGGAMTRPHPAWRLLLFALLLAGCDTPSSSTSPWTESDQADDPYDILIAPDSLDQLPYDPPPPPTPLDPMPGGGLNSGGDESRRRSFMNVREILMVGNSHLRHNEVDTLLAYLARRDAIADSVAVTRYSVDGSTWLEHAGRDSVLFMLSDERWDSIVLQENSLQPLNDPDAMGAGLAALLASADQAPDGRPDVVLMMTWARRDKPETTARIGEVYDSLAALHDLRVSPVGHAWHAAIADRPYMVLHQPDGNHATLLGSYLAACTLYGSLLGSSPLGLDGISGAQGDGHQAYLEETAWAACRAHHP